MRNLTALLFVILAACSPQPVYRHNTTPLSVAQVDLNRYLGHWHEAARLPNDFERGCASATAEYSRRDDGLISVANSCRGEDGKIRVSHGRAKPSGGAGEGKLQVSFFGPFWANYWVLERADDYSWAIVGEPEGRYRGVLTRADIITPPQRADLQQRVTRLGYRPGDMIWAS
jgi:apolipoprotein D and lipocalin family protein